MNDAGFFKQEGLDVDLIFVLSSPTVQGYARRRSGIVLAPIAKWSWIRGYKAATLIAIGSMANVVAFYVMASPEIKSVADLKGETIGNLPVWRLPAISA